MNFKELGIFSITPVAKLEGGLNGPRFIAERKMLKGERELISVLPPNYDLLKSIQIKQYILEAAIAKHGYIPFDHEPLISFEDYEKYLRDLNKPKEK